VTYKTGFGFDDRIYWIFIQLVIIFSQITIFDWTLSTTDHTAVIHSSNWTPGVRVKVKVTLRLEDFRQSVRLGDKPLETHNHRLFSAELLR
jgi:hypothetical protein